MDLLLAINTVVEWICGKWDVDPSFRFDEWDAKDVLDRFGPVTLHEVLAVLEAGRFIRKVEPRWVDGKCDFSTLEPTALLRTWNLDEERRKAEATEPDPRANEKPAPATEAEPAGDDETPDNGLPWWLSATEIADHAGVPDRGRDALNKRLERLRASEDHRNLWREFKWFKVGEEQFVYDTRNENVIEATRDIKRKLGC